MHKVEIFRGWCKKCDICIAFCPPQILEADETSYPVVREPEKCTGCKLCEIRCPDFAILVHRDEESETETGSSSGQ